MSLIYIRGTSIGGAFPLVADLVAKIELLMGPLLVQAKARLKAAVSLKVKLPSVALAGQIGAAFKVLPIGIDVGATAALAARLKAKLSGLNVLLQLALGFPILKFRLAEYTGPISAMGATIGDGSAVTPLAGGQTFAIVLLVDANAGATSAALKTLIKAA